MLHCLLADDRIEIFGYRFSVYTRVVTLGLAELRLPFDYHEVDPFQPVAPPALAGLHPFGRVPILRHRGHRIYETAAITRYLDAQFPGTGLIPDTALAAARMQQVMGIVDSYGYAALVRQVFTNVVFRPLEGVAVRPDELQAGLLASRKVLAALEEVAQEGLVLNAAGPSLADIHLFPMIDYFRLAPEGASLLGDHPALMTWWGRFALRPSAVQTRPDLMTLAAGG